MNLAILTILAIFELQEILMTAPAIIPDRAHRAKVTLTNFHNATGEILDMGLRAPVTITKHGRPHMTFVDAGYFERLEEIAAGNILAALDRKHIASVDMPDDVAALIASQIPSEEEIASGKWKNG